MSESFDLGDDLEEEETQLGIMLENTTVDNVRLQNENQELKEQLASLRIEAAQQAFELVELRKDKVRLDYFEGLSEAYGFEDVHEGNRWSIEGPFPSLRKALDSEMQPREPR